MASNGQLLFQEAAPKVEEYVEDWVEKSNRYWWNVLKRDSGMAEATLTAVVDFSGTNWSKATNRHFIARVLNVS